MRTTMVALAVLTVTSAAAAQEKPAGEAKAAPAAQSQEAEEARETPRPTPFRPYRRTIGENGDLFLVVPFLAPVGPISGAFFGN